MREDGGYDVIIAAWRPLENVDKHISVYDSNDQRLTGLHETAKITEFKYGVSDRGASIRIPWQLQMIRKVIWKIGVLLRIWILIWYVQH